ncbi:MAG: DNA polymerase domain-containing protein [Saprospiraceae bacterium]
MNYIFGYTGFKNAPLSSPNIFEQINNWGRIALIDTKNVFEEAGYTVIHTYIDSIFAKSENRINKESIDSLLYQVEMRTGLPISLDCIYKWVAFLPSKMNKKYSVPNSYFGVFEDGTIKTRGIECRRGDKPPYVKEGQLMIIEILSKMENLSDLNTFLPEVYKYVMNHVRRIKYDKVSNEELIITQRLSKNLEDYKIPSHAAKAGIQLKNNDVDIRAGSKVQFIYVKGKPRVLAWDLVHKTKNYQIDKEYYIYLFENAVKTVLEPFGVEEYFISNLINLDPMKQLSFIEKDLGIRRFSNITNKNYEQLNDLNNSFINL